MSKTIHSEMEKIFGNKKNRKGPEDERALLDSSGSSSESSFSSSDPQNAPIPTPIPASATASAKTSSATESSKSQGVASWATTESEEVPHFVHSEEFREREFVKVLGFVEYGSDPVHLLPVLNEYEQSRVASIINTWMCKDDYSYMFFLSERWLEYLEMMQSRDGFNTRKIIVIGDNCTSEWLLDGFVERLCTKGYTVFICDITRETKFVKLILKYAGKSVSYVDNIFNIRDEVKIILHLGNEKLTEPDFHDFANFNKCKIFCNNHCCQLNILQNCYALLIITFPFAIVREMTTLGMIENEENHINTSVLGNFSRSPKSWFNVALIDMCIDLRWLGFDVGKTLIKIYNGKNIVVMENNYKFTTFPMSQERISFFESVQRLNEGVTDAKILELFLSVFRYYEHSPQEVESLTFDSLTQYEKKILEVFSSNERVFEAPCRKMELLKNAEQPRKILWGMTIYRIEILPIFQGFELKKYLLYCILVAHSSSENALRAHVFFKNPKRISHKYHPDDHVNEVALRKELYSNEPQVIINYCRSIWTREYYLDD